MSEYSDKQNINFGQKLHNIYIMENVVCECNKTLRATQSFSVKKCTDACVCFEVYTQIVCNAWMNVWYYRDCFWVMHAGMLHCSGQGAWVACMLHPRCCSVFLCPSSDPSSSHTFKHSKSLVGDIHLIIGHCSLLSAFFACCDALAVMSQAPWWSPESNTIACIFG